MAHLSRLATRHLRIFSGIILLLSACSVRPTQKLALDPPTESGRLSPKVDFSTYKSPNSRPGQIQDVIVIVAISGGGLRAANFGIGALMGFEHISCDDTSSIRNEIDYLSSASGGGLAAAEIIIQTLANGQKYSPFLSQSFRYDSAPPMSSDTWDSNCGNRKETWQSKITGWPEAFLSQPVGWDSTRLATNSASRFQRNYRALATRYPPWGGRSFDRDYGDSIETAFHKIFFDGDDLTLKDVFVPADSTATPTTPYWIANATMYASGERVPLTPDVIRALGVLHSPHNLEMGCTGTNGDQLALSAAMFASAAFPLYRPYTMTENETGTCATGDYAAIRNVNLIDGGVSDTTGLLTALDIAKFERSMAPIQPIVIISVDAFTGTSSGWYQPVGNPRLSSRTGVWPVANLFRDAARTEVGERLRDLADSDSHIHFIEINFDTLCEAFSDPDKCRVRPLSCTETGNLADLRYQVRGIRTDWKLRNGDQDKLIQAGLAATALQSQSLKDAICPPVSSGGH